MPEDCAAGVEEGLEVDHRGDGVGEEADEVGEGDVGDAVGWRGEGFVRYLPGFAG